MSGTDLRVFGATAVILIVIAFMANLLPAVRATAIGPVKVLRTE